MLKAVNSVDNKIATSKVNIDLNAVIVLLLDLCMITKVLTACSHALKATGMNRIEDKGLTIRVLKVCSGEACVKILLQSVIVS